ncbi:MAG TPA: transcription factor S [candidate division Zixibacteria bacterium]|nr:transcription factor S [candidate division Zixibacteria bacterium]
MSMEFCEECGSMLQPMKVDGKVVITCPNCGAGKKELKKDDLKLSEKITHSEKDQMVVIENPEELDTMPTKPMRCPKCEKIVKTQYWAVQTRSGDEAATRFYRCTKCKQTWREYD